MRSTHPRTRSDKDTSSGGGALREEAFRARAERGSVFANLELSIKAGGSFHFINIFTNDKTTSSKITTIRQKKRSAEKLFSKFKIKVIEYKVFLQMSSFKYQKPMEPQHNSFKFVVPQINVQVTVTQYRDNVKHWLVEPQIWHPHVFWIGSYMMADDENDVKNQLSFGNLGNPANIDAGIDFKKNKDTFFERNRRVVEHVHGPKECPVCLTEFNDPKNVRFMCYNLHWICKDCFYTNQIASCVLCRFKFKYNFQTFRDVKSCITCLAPAKVTTDDQNPISFCSVYCQNKYTRKTNFKTRLE